MEEILISDFVDLYLIEIKPFFKSYYSVAAVLKVFSVTVTENVLQSLRPPHVHRYVQTRLAAGIRPSTVNRELSVISAAINHAVRKWGVSLVNPVRHQWLKASPPRLRYLTRQEAFLLIAHASALRQDVGDFVRLALNTGCRKNELLTLRWSDVDFDRRYFILRPENTKSAKRRAVPLNQASLDALRSRLEGNSSEWVFARRDGRRVKTINFLFRKAVLLSGLEDFKVHDLRHTFASWLVSEGVELVKVRDLLGHKSITMTERYAHLMPNRLHDAVEILDAFLS